jgi:hypothetical protein
MPTPVQFVEARKAFHAALLKETLTTNIAGVVSNADKDSKLSRDIAKVLLNCSRQKPGERIAGQSSGNKFEGFVLTS